MSDLYHILAAGGVWEKFADAGVTVKIVMLLLAAMSLVTWYIIAVKSLYIRSASTQSRVFMDSFWRSKDIEQIYKHAQMLRSSPVASMFLAGYTELAKLTADERQGARESDLENVQRALRRAQMEEITKLESMVPVLATTGSSAPFIGLFGTVWGIMRTFDDMRSSGAETTLDRVGPGISEALLATAIGLIAAIPAVMAYNYFQRRTRVLVAQMQTFEQDYLNIIKRHFLS